MTHYYLYNYIQSPHFLISIISISLFVKSYFIKVFIPQGLRKTTIKKPWFFLLGTLIGSLFGDIAWIVKLLREIAFPDYSYALVTFFIRIAWAFLIIQYQSLALFIQSLSEKNFKLRLFHKISIIISILFSAYFFYLAFFNPLTFANERDRELAKSLLHTPSTEIQVMRYVVLYLLNLIILPAFYTTIKKLRKNNLPRILHQQLRIFMQYLLTPYLIAEFLQAGNFNFTVMQVNLYPIVSISTALITYAIYYCIQKVMGLRFLNVGRHVHAQHTIMIINDVKNALDQLSQATNVHELGHITSRFFKEALHIPLRSTTLYIRNTTPTETDLIRSNEIKPIIEHFINLHETPIQEYINEHRILIYDEIAFSNFYEETNQHLICLSFLDTINADIFIPVYAQQKIIAYIVITKNARMECYTDIERDEMLVFSGYLGNVINVLHNRSIEPLLRETKELKDTLYLKKQELKHCKESIRSFLTTQNKQKHIGIIFYKNRRFVFGNQAAKELIGLNLNMQEGHALTKQMKHIVQQVELYKAPQTNLIKSADNSTHLVIYAVPHLEHNNIIITIMHPGINDLIAKKIEHLYDPNQWDYVLYLETTAHGKLINQFLPSSGQTILYHKINLLKEALNKKVTFIHITEEDMHSLVEILHHISGRETLQTIHLQTNPKNNDIGIKIFGINPLFDFKIQEPCLLEKLDTNGTLFIKNIEFLDIESQKHLAEFIKYGLFRKFNSDQQLANNTYVLCSSNYTIDDLTQNKMLIPQLAYELKKHAIIFPPLNTIPVEELYDLADNFTEQVMKTTAFKHFLCLTDREKNQLIAKQLTSIQEFKYRIQQMVIHKSKQHNVYHETDFDPAYEITDPDLVEAARLGKHALKDQKIMTMLWQKFKNQNKIASFLGVNRSSVNRRIKDYNLHLYDVKESHDITRI